MNGSPESGTELRDGRYVIVGVLGEGSQGATYDAVDKKEGRPVAIKRFDVRNARSWKDVELAEREARVLGRLRHPGLPAYVEHFESDGSLYLVMERIDGESLASIRARSGRVDAEEIARMVREVGAILAYLHAQSPPVVHRDVKPGNVIRRPDGSFAVVDFGAVRDRLRPDGGSTVVGTFGYMAPEQFQGRASAKTDVYALGATALAMLTGVDPEALPHKGLAIDVGAALGSTRMPAGFVRALSAMLAPDPDHRADSVAAVFPEAPSPGRASASTPRGGKNAKRGPEPTWERSRKSERREAKRRRKAARRAARRSRGLPLVAWPFVVFGLLVARIAVVATTKLAVPALLHLLARVFGRHLRRVADDVRHEGDEALENLAEVWESLRAPRDGAAEPGYRVADDDSDARAAEEAEVVEAEVVEDHEDDDAPRRRRR